ncbi:MAG: flagellar hook protein FlgE [Betaproteobacteria bacterium]|nr:flagellar hook protein FlgE [Betaproteobacteria bacterium]
MSFDTALSGLSAASQDLDVIGNNVANSGTVGYKQSQIQFADIYANSLADSASLQVGTGTKVAQVEQQFVQGNITASNNPMDVAINGQGFFVMDSGGSTVYTRNGQFQLNKNGNIVNANGDILKGYPLSSNGQITTGALSDLVINSSNMAPSATTKINAGLNLDATSTAPATAFNTTDPTTYNNSTSTTIYDSLGNSHVLQTYYVTNGTGSWNVYASLDGTPVGYTPPATAVPVTTLTFSSSGALSGGSPVSLSLPLTDGASTPMSVSLNYTGTTQYGSVFGVNSMQQNGYTSGQLSNFTIGSDGMITGNYTNSQSTTLGQVALANFADPNGLQAIGNNEWISTYASGPALAGVPGSASLGVLQSSATESSNVDLTKQLVDMITAQRDYQANAQTIKTEDAVTQTLLSLR